MILRKLTATFGKLDHETLELNGGLNVLSAPNEWGKSTWSAFLLAMFYGLKSSERSIAKTGRLVEKDRYLPWNGKTMSGSVELTWQGRNITIQRTSKGRTRFGVFDAFDTDTGEKLPWLTAENCGVTLLGVERSVFVRSAFIGQSAIEVSQDAELGRRLHSLASTGEETVSSLDTQRRLNEWKNHVRHNKTGAIPAAEAELASVTQKLDAIRAQHLEDLQFAEQKEKLEAQERELEHICACLRAGELLKRRAQLDAAERELSEKRQAAEEARKAIEALPEDAALRELDDRFDRLAADREAFRRAGEGLSTAPPEPPCSPVFSGSTPEEAQRRAQTDAEAVRRLQTPLRKSRLWIAALALLLCGAALAFFLEPVWIGLAVCGAGAVFLALCLILQENAKRAWQARQAEAEQILRNYSADSADEILAAAVRYGEALHRYERDVEDAHKKWSARNEELTRLNREEEELLRELHAFRPDADADGAKQAIREAQQRIRDAENAATRAEAAENTLRSLRESYGELAEVEPPEEDFSDRWRLEDAERQLGDLRAQLAQIRSALAASGGRAAAFGDPAELEAERDTLTERIAELQKRYAALTLAQETLAEADRRMQARVSPRLNKLAGEYLSRMTGDHYEKLLLDQDFALTAKPTDSDMVRPIQALSAGTAEQVYFALRLAICSLALDDDVPIVLDDAFVFFDDERLRQALRLLQEEAETRQILLFSCQSRERQIIEKR